MIGAKRFDREQSCSRQRVMRLLMPEPTQGQVSAALEGSSMDERHLRNALGRFVTGVTVITTRTAEGKLEGLTANSFSAVSLDPPLVLWSLRKSSSLMATFEGALTFEAVAPRSTLSCDFSRVRCSCRSCSSSAYVVQLLRTDTARIHFDRSDRYAAHGIGVSASRGQDILPNCFELGENGQQRFFRRADV